QLRGFPLRIRGLRSLKQSFDAILLLLHYTVRPCETRAVQISLPIDFSNSFKSLIVHEAHHYPKYLEIGEREEEVKIITGTPGTHSVEVFALQYNGSELFHNIQPRKL